MPGSNIELQTGRAAEQEARRKHRSFAKQLRADAFDIGRIEAFGKEQGEPARFLACQRRERRRGGHDRIDDSVGDSGDGRARRPYRPGATCGDDPRRSNL